MTTKHLWQSEPDDSRLLASRQLTKVGGDDAAPAFATTVGVITVQDLLKVKVKIYSDDATSVLGEEITYTVWRFYRELAEDPLGIASAGGWVRGESKTLDPKYDSGGSKEHVHEVQGAEKVFFQVTGVAATTALDWLRIDVHVVTARMEAIPVEASGIASALREVFSFSSTGLVVDTELTLDGATLVIDNLFSMSTDGAATGATWGKLNASQQLETDLMQIGGENVFPKNLHENETLISECDDHTDWALQGNGANKADSLNHILGTGSVSFDKIAGGVDVYLDQTLGTPVNLSKFDAHDMVSFCMYLGSVVNVSYAFIRLGTDNANYNEWHILSDDLTADVWNVLTRPIGTVEGAVTGNGWNPSSVAYVAVGLVFGAAGDTLADVLVDRVLVHTNPNVAMELGSDVATYTGVANTRTQRVVLASDGPTNTRLGTNGAAASATGSQAAQLRFIGENLGSLVSVIQDCNDNTDWAAVSDAANLADDTEHITGTVSVEWDKTGGTNVLSGIDDTLATSLDLTRFAPTDYVLACFYIPDLSDIDSVHLYLGTDNANYTEWEWPDTDLMVGWNVVYAPLSDYTAVAGTGMQQAAIAYVQVAVEFDAAGDLLNDMKVDYIAMVSAESLGESIGMVYATNVQRAATTVGYANSLTTNLNRELILAGYDWTTHSVRSGEINPITTHVLDESLADTTNINATTYYPSATGGAMYGYKDFSITGSLIDADGTLTLTVEATNDEDTAAGDWIDVTRGGYRPDDNTTGNASITVTNGTETYALDFDNLNYRYYRVKVTQTGATNTVIIKARRKGN